MIAVLQHIEVTDARISEDIVVRAGNSRQVYKPVPTVASYLALTLGENLLRDHPAFAEALTRSPLKLSVRIDAISGDGPDATSRSVPSVLFRLSMVSAPSGGSEVLVSWTSLCSPCLNGSTNDARDWFQDMLKAKAAEIIKTFIRDASPHLPPPPVQTIPVPVVS